MFLWKLLCRIEKHSIAVNINYLWSVRQRHLINVSLKICNLCAARNVVALVELEGFFKHLLTEPNTSVGVQQTFVKIVCDTTAILNFTQHIMNSHPRNTLGGEGKEKNGWIQEVDTQID